MPFMLVHDSQLEEEIRKQNIVEEAVRKADAVIIGEGTNADDMLELTYLVGMAMMEKIGFQLYIKREIKRINEELDHALGRNANGTGRKS